MTKFYVLTKKRINSNTAAHGFGDYPEYVTQVMTSVEAETLRKAMNAAKRKFPNLTFSGINADRIYTEAEMIDRGYKHLLAA